MGGQCENDWPRGWNWWLLIHFCTLYCCEQKMCNPFHRGKYQLWATEDLFDACRVPNVLLDHSGLDLAASEGIWSNMDLNKTVVYILSHKRSCSGLGRTEWSLYSAHRVPGYFCLPGLFSFAWGSCPQDCFTVVTIAPAITSVFWRSKKKKRERQEKHTSLSLPLPQHANHVNQTPNIVLLSCPISLSPCSASCLTRRA